jgi:hypothetical protein
VPVANAVSGEALTAFARPPDVAEYLPTGAWYDAM